MSQLRRWVKALSTPVARIPFPSMGVESEKQDTFAPEFEPCIYICGTCTRGDREKSGVRDQVERTDPARNDFRKPNKWPRSHAKCQSEEKGRWGRRRNPGRRGGNTATPQCRNGGGRVMWYWCR